jgi:hypothetical protein
MLIKVFHLNFDEFLVKFNLEPIFSFMKTHRHIWPIKMLKIKNILICHQWIGGNIKMKNENRIVETENTQFDKDDSADEKAIKCQKLSEFFEYACKIVKNINVSFVIRRKQDEKYSNVSYDFKGVRTDYMYYLVSPDRFSKEYDYGSNWCPGEQFISIALGEIKNSWKGEVFENDLQDDNIHKEVIEAVCKIIDKVALHNARHLLKTNGTSFVIDRCNDSNHHVVISRSGNVLNFDFNCKIGKIQEVPLKFTHSDEAYKYFFGKYQEKIFRIIKSEYCKYRCSSLLRIEVPCPGVEECNNPFVSRLVLESLSDLSKSLKNYNPQYMDNARHKFELKGEKTEIAHKPIDLPNHIDCCIRGKIKNELRKFKKEIEEYVHNPDVNFMNFTDITPDPGLQPGDLMIKEETGRELVEILQSKLSKLEFQVWTKSELEKRKNIEIAEMLSLSVKQVEEAKRRAKNKIKKLQNLIENILKISF